MAKVEKSIVINAPWQKVDSVANDGTRMPEWFAGIESSNADSTYPQVGGVTEHVYKAAGMSFNLTATSIDYQQGSHLTLKMDGMIIGTQYWTIEPQDDATRLSVVFDYEVPGGGLGKMLDKLVIERTNSANLEKSLINLKDLIESS